METGYINYVAEMVAKHLGITPIPTFGRWNKHSGHAKRSYYNRENVFTIAQWAKNENRFLQTYFIVHEVCHFYDYTDGHGGKFREAEAKALALFDMEAQYGWGKRYPYALTVFGTTVWSNATAKTQLSHESLDNRERKSLGLI